MEGNNSALLIVNTTFSDFYLEKCNLLFLNVVQENSGLNNVLFSNITHFSDSGQVSLISFINSSFNLTFNQNVFSQIQQVLKIVFSKIQNYNLDVVLQITNYNSMVFFISNTFILNNVDESLIFLSDVSVLYLENVYIEQIH